MKPHKNNDGKAGHKAIVPCCLLTLVEDKQDAKSKIALVANQKVKEDNVITDVDRSLCCNEENMTRVEWKGTPCY